MAATRYLLAMIGIIAFQAASLANVGVFNGSGHTVRLVQGTDVQLVSEDVEIWPLRSGWPMDGTPGLATDRVAFDCTFVLKNLSKNSVAVQVGFPLNSQDFSEAPLEEDRLRSLQQDCSEVVRKFKFIARDENATYHTRFVGADQSKQLAAIFLWDMTFSADQVRKLHVTYELPMTFTITMLGKRQGAA